MLDIWYGLNTLLAAKIVGSIALLFIYVAARLLFRRAIGRIAQARRMTPARVSTVNRAAAFLTTLILAGLLAIIWSIRFQSLALASGAILATIGIALFAQWSILSNVTAGIVMFWRFPIHVGDRVGMLSDKEFSAVVDEFTLFFVILQDDAGNKVTVPNSLMLQQIFIVYNRPRHIPEQQNPIDLPDLDTDSDTP